LLVGLIPPLDKRFVRVFVLILAKCFQILQHLLPFLDLQRSLVLRLCQQFFGGLVRVFFPDVDGPKLHVLVESTEDFLPVALCFLISLSVEAEGVEHFGLVFLADLIKQKVGTSHIDIVLAAPLEEEEVVIERFPKISLSHMHGNA
jgi:hypothetical protein